MWYTVNNMKENSVKIIAFVGMSGSGKSEAVNFMTEKGYPKVYFGGMIYKEMERRGIEITEANEKDFRVMIRETEGKDWVVRQAIEEVKQLIQAGQKKIVLDGLYSWTEYKMLKKEFPRMMTVIAILTPKKLRYKRVSERKDRPRTLDEIRTRDKVEIENVEKGGPIAMADYFILNDKGISELHESLEKILKEIEF